jgi:hypothetical protein
VLNEPLQPHTVFVIDLYPRDGARPRDFESALARKSDLLFANQTYLRLAAYRRELLLRNEIARLKQKGEPGSQTLILLLSYQPSAEEAGSGRPFDLSPDSGQQRWRSGEADMEEALGQLMAGQNAHEPLLIIRRRDASPRLSSTAGPQRART